MNRSAAGRSRLLLVLGVLCAVLLLLNSMRYYARIDFSRGKTHTPAAFTRDLLRSVPEPLLLTYYLSGNLKPLYPGVSAVRDFLYSYAAENRRISVRVTDPVSAEDQAALASLAVQPQQIQTASGRETGFSLVYSAIVLAYGGKTAVIPFVLSADSLEYDLNTRIQSLVHGISRSCLILAGNGFSLQEDYPYVVPWLNAAGFSCIEATPAVLGEYAPSIPLVVLGSSKLSAEDVLAVENRIRSGGQAVFAVSSADVRIYENWSAAPLGQNPLHRLFELWGISLRPELLLDVSNYRITMQGGAQNSQYEYVNYPFWATVLPQFAASSHALSSVFSGLQLFWPSPLALLETGGISPEPVLYSSPAARLMPPVANAEQPFITDPFYQYFSPESASLFLPEKSPRGYVLAASLEGSVPLLFGGGFSVPARLLVIGDQYFCSKMIEYTNSPRNMDFLVSALLWVSGSDEMLSIRAKGSSYTELTKITDSGEFERTKRRTLAFTLGFVPLLFAVSGAVTLFKRRKR